MHCEKCKTEVLKAVTKLSGINEVSVDLEKQMLVVIGDVDPVCVVKRVRKIGKIAEMLALSLDIHNHVMVELASFFDEIEAIYLSIYAVLKLFILISIAHVIVGIRKNNFKSDRPRDERRNDHRNKETYHPYVAPRRDQGHGERYRQDYRPFKATRGGHQRPGIGALTNPPREILATERHLNLPAPRPTGVRTTKENSDKFCEYHREHGHITNHCKQLKKQLEIALESGRLDHLLKDWKQRDTAGDRGTSKNNDKRNDKVINMIRSHKGMKRRNGDREEGWMKAPITFPPITTEDLSDVPLIVEGDIASYLVRRIYVDEGSSVDVMYEHCFNNLSADIKERLRETSTSLVGFSGETNKPLGKIELEVRFGDNGMYRRTIMTFCVVRSPSPYNVILGRIGLKEMRAIPSKIHSMTKFPTPKGITTLIARPSMVSECRRLEEKQTVEKPKVEVPQEAEITGEDDVVGTEEVLINPAYPEQLVVIGKDFSKDSRRNLIELLRKNKVVFAWEPTDMTGVPRRLIRHHLNVNISDTPVAQKKRNFSAEKNQVITKEVEEWMKAGIVRPVRYPTWISNPVLVN
ncbi:reverse transcriptase domain-containing protein [Artemisia annua]|uniref:Reverse transcriptase domain-containing protein n=1 Tax=Artemisia annua TaxID=35608 RepID=A0A2U1MZ21_ARTAN|nr:reverse transcriptase domain-containing protein [Artemisia annua]